MIYSIDATRNDGKLGRLVNDAEEGSPLNNCLMKLILVDNYPRLCLFAKRTIKCGEELRYDYGDTHLPWRQVSIQEIEIYFFPILNGDF